MLQGVMKAICEKIPKTLLFLGLAGSGKDTQADLLCELCSGQKISTGGLARNEKKNGTRLGKMAGEYMGKGLLIPDDLVYEILRSNLLKFDKEKLWILTGVVRTIDQVPMFEDTLRSVGRKLDRVVFLELSEETIVHRLSRRRFCPKCGATYHLDFEKSKKDGICDIDGEKLIQRNDDKPEIIKTRIREEKAVINEVLDKFEERGILIRVDGEPSIEKIHEELVERLSNEG